MPYLLYRKQHLNCNNDQTWNFFSREEHLAKNTPKDMNFTITSTDEKMAIFNGMRIHRSVPPLFSIPQKWESEVRDVLPNSSYTDFQLRVPIWKHTHNEPTEYFSHYEGCRAL